MPKLRGLDYTEFEERLAAAGFATEGDRLLAATTDPEQRLAVKHLTFMERFGGTSTGRISSDPNIQSILPRK